MAEMKEVPAIRFKGFNEAWTEKRLGDICTIGDIDHRMPPSVSDGVPYVMTGDFIGLNEFDFKNAKLISIEDYDQLSKKIKPEVGDVIMARYASVGAVRYVETDIKFLVSYSCAILKLGHSNGRFVFHSLQSNYSQNQIELEINTGSQRNIGIDSLKKLLFRSPFENEQTQIGSYFQHLDKLISLHQTKVNKLTNLKKAMLEKMFPKQGADVPEIRFKGFEKAWDEKTVGGIFDDLKGTGLSKEKIGNQGKYKCILYGHLFTKFSEVIDEIDSRTDYYEGVLSKENDILMPSSTTTTGIDLAKASSLKESGVLLGGDIIILRMKELGSSDFFAYYLTNGVSKKIAEVTQGTTIIHLYFSGLKDVLLKVPCPAEQALIGAYFQNLDKTISLHQTELEKLGNLKKACLEKMFV